MALDVGVMLNNLERDRLKAFRVAAECGFRIVHTSALPERWLTGPERGEYLAAARDSGLTIHTMFVGFDGQSYADLASTRRTVGLVLPEFRDHRCRIVRLYADLAHELGVAALGAHIGFIPPERENPLYSSLVDAVRGIAEYCGRHTQTFHLETGQESSTVLLRFLQDVDLPNVGVNFDPANLVLYGTDDPLAALHRLAPYVGGVHCKDALPPTQPNSLGSEVAVGSGTAEFAGLLNDLWARGYRGPLIIEREHGPHVLEDVAAARTYLERLNPNLVRSASSPR